MIRHPSVCCVCRESVQAVVVSLEDELRLLDQRFGELLASAQSPDCSAWPNAEVGLLALQAPPSHVLLSTHSCRQSGMHWPR